MHARIRVDQEVSLLIHLVNFPIQVMISLQCNDLTIYGHVMQLFNNIQRGARKLVKYFEPCGGAVDIQLVIMGII